MQLIRRLASQSIHSIYIAFAFLLPIFFLPLTQEFYDLPKWMLFVTVALLILLVWTVTVGTSGTMSLSLTPTSVGLVALSIAAFSSLIFSSPNKVESLVAPFGLMTFLGSTIVSVFGPSLLSRKDVELIRWALFISVGILSTLAIYQFFGLGKTIFPAAPFLSDPLWTPAGTSIALVSILVVVIPALFDQALSDQKNGRDVTFVTSGLLLTLSVIGAGLTLYQLIPKLPESLLPLSAGWAIMLEIFKTPKLALVGVGAENFLGAFTAGRPPALNSGALWNARFTSNSTFFLHLATTMGIAGIVGTVLFLRAFLVQALSYSRRHARSFTLVLGCAILLFVPPQLPVFLVLVLLLFTGETQRDHINITLSPTLKSMWWMVVTVTLIVFVGVFYAVFRVYRGEFTFYRSLVAAQANNGTDTYNLQIKAIGDNPFAAKYHLAYSQTNLALASSLAQAGTTEGTTAATLSDADRQTISQLLQQAIREAKIATTLAPDNVIAWETLAKTYQNMIGLADGAETWAAAAYVRAIQIDPSNPINRLNLAGVYLRHNKNDEALQELLTAATLKSDMANTHYNLAFVYRQRKEHFKEAQELKQTLALIPAGSNDTEKIMRELSEAKTKITPNELKLLETGIVTPGQNITDSLSPIPSDVPNLEPRLELPDESSPAATP